MGLCMAAVPACCCGQLEPASLPERDILLLVLLLLPCSRLVRSSQGIKPPAQIDIRMDAKRANTQKNSSRYGVGIESRGQSFLFVFPVFCSVVFPVFSLLP